MLSLSTESYHLRASGYSRGMVLIDRYTCDAEVAYQSAYSGLRKGPGDNKIN